MALLVVSTSFMQIAYTESGAKNKRLPREPCEV
jgi:hypothetical protein